METKKIASDADVIDAISAGKQISDGNGLCVIPPRKDKSAAWVFSYTYDHRRLGLRLGIYPNVSIEHAREVASEYRDMLLNGVNPSDVRKSKKRIRACLEFVKEEFDIASVRPGSLEEVALAWYATKRKEWKSSTKSRIHGLLNNHILKHLGRASIAKVKSSEIYRICEHLQVDQGKVETGTRVLALFNRIFNFAVTRFDLPQHPFIDAKSDLARAIPRTRAAITDVRKLKQFCEDADACGGRFVTKVALRLMMLVFLRSSELRLANWSEFDLENGLWMVPLERMKRPMVGQKNQEDHLVPLATQACEMLGELYRVTGKTGKVFPGQGKRGYLSENTLNKMIRRMGYCTKVDMTCHGFRATARTILVEKLNWNKDDIERQLDHAVSDNNGAAYDRTKLKRNRMAMMQAWADYLDQLTSGLVDLSDEFPEFKPITETNPIIEKTPRQGRGRHSRPTSRR